MIFDVLFYASCARMIFHSIQENDKYIGLRDYMFRVISKKKKKEEKNMLHYKIRSSFSTNIRPI